MPSVHVRGWSKGCNTVLAIKALRDKAMLPLNEALALANRIVDGEDVTIPLPTHALADGLAESLSSLGWNATCDRVPSTLVSAPSTVRGTPERPLISSS